MALTALNPSPARTHTDSAARRRDADGMAVASFVLGLIGLLLFNAVFGPCAIVLATLAIARQTQRRGRALLGLALGFADIVLLIVLVTMDNTVFWQFG
ncbi:MULTISPECIES: DUF4190 domain-containing protein [Streptomyces]|uniref:DUF4190 domain-containing protein n=1 Tax=Streptomyces lonegramiae TaxID=3075524 RepID=A0ABU2XJG2_9ACTN|nr:DUF4190 domain-containing protein [Streptomyces sp. DSM 41529]MDT0545982.1 DUF4190 domain-containing protein [Streptomyces sp. DSM 41529]